MELVTLKYTNQPTYIVILLAEYHQRTGLLDGRLAALSISGP
jgi:hypothetical protein